MGAIKMDKNSTSPNIIIGGSAVAYHGNNYNLKEAIANKIEESSVVDTTEDKKPQNVTNIKDLPRDDKLFTKKPIYKIVARLMEINDKIANPGNVSNEQGKLIVSKILDDVSISKKKLVMTIHSLENEVSRLVGIDAIAYDNQIRAYSDDIVKFKGHLSDAVRNIKALNQRFRNFESGIPNNGDISVVTGIAKVAALGDAMKALVKDESLVDYCIDTTISTGGEFLAFLIVNDIGDINETADGFGEQFIASAMSLLGVSVDGLAYKLTPSTPQHKFIHKLLANYVDIAPDLVEKYSCGEYLPNDYLIPIDAKDKDELDQSIGELIDVLANTFMKDSSKVIGMDSTDIENSIKLFYSNLSDSSMDDIFKASSNLCTSLTKSSLAGKEVLAKVLTEEQMLKFTNTTEIASDLMNVIMTLQRVMSDLMGAVPEEMRAELGITSEELTLSAVKKITITNIEESAKLYKGTFYTALKLIDLIFPEEVAAISLATNTDEEKEIAKEKIYKLTSVLLYSTFGVFGLKYGVYALKTLKRLHTVPGDSTKEINKDNMAEAIRSSSKKNK